MSKLERNVNVSIEVTPRDLAEIFCDMDGNEQAEFFSCIGLIVESYWDKPFALQAQAITDSDELTPEGRAIMQTLGDYSSKAENNS